MEFITIPLMLLGFILLYIVSMGLIIITFTLTIKAVSRIIFEDTFKDNEDYCGKNRD